MLVREKLAPMRAKHIQATTSVGGVIIQVPAFLGNI